MREQYDMTLFKFIRLLNELLGEVFGNGKQDNGKNLILQKECFLAIKNKEGGEIYKQ